MADIEIFGAVDSFSVVSFVEFEPLLSFDDSANFFEAPSSRSSAISWSRFGSDDDLFSETFQDR